MIPRSLAIAAAALLITGCTTQQQPYVDTNLWHGAPITCDNLPPGDKCTPGTPNTSRTQTTECVGDCTAYNAEHGIRVLTRAEWDAEQEAAHKKLQAEIDEYHAAENAAEDRKEKEEQQAAAARRRAAERAVKAEEAAVEKAKAEEAKADQDFDNAHPIGARCESTLGRFETDVLSSLSRTQKAVVLSSRCSSQHKILQAVGILPPDRRIEAFDRLLDSAAR